MDKTSTGVTVTERGMRPIQLHRDLASLADLMEVVFASTLDSGGRAALREMRALGQMGIMLTLLGRFNELAVGMSQGYVWIENGKVVGNVSIYPAEWPREMGRVWIIANVGVHPSYQRRGIARELMVATLDLIRRKGGRMAVLQVDHQNHPALNLYLSLGFRRERTWTNWRREIGAYIPPQMIEQHDVYIRRRRRSEWAQEMRLAEQLRPQSAGGLGWNRPNHQRFFHKSALAMVGDWFNLRHLERLVIAPEEGEPLRASLWVDTMVGTKTRLTLLVDPAYQGTYDALLLDTLIRREMRSTLVIEHPTDEIITTHTLQYYMFTPQRTVTHMLLPLA